MRLNTNSMLLSVLATKPSESSLLKQSHSY